MNDRLRDTTDRLRSHWSNIPPAKRIRAIVLGAVAAVLVIALVIVYGLGGDPPPPRDIENRANEIQQALEGSSTADLNSEPPPPPGQPQPKSVRDTMREGGGG